MTRSRIAGAPSPVYGPFEPDVIIPAQWYRGRHSVRTGGLRLFEAVLEEVMHDLQKFGGIDSVRAGRRMQEAVMWIRSEDRAWPCSFLNICDVLDLDVDATRRALGQIATGRLVPSPRRLRLIGRRQVGGQH